jgi:hypothetical protein
VWRGEEEKGGGDGGVGEMEGDRGFKFEGVRGRSAQNIGVARF